MNPFRAWLFEKLGGQYLPMAEAIERDLRAADQSAWEQGDSLKHVTVYVGDYSTFRLEIRRENASR